MRLVAPGRGQKRQIQPVLNTTTAPTNRLRLFRHQTKTRPLGVYTQICEVILRVDVPHSRACYLLSVGRGEMSGIWQRQVGGTGRRSARGKGGAGPEARRSVRHISRPFPAAGYTCARAHTRSRTHANTHKHVLGSTTSTATQTRARADALRRAAAEPLPQTSPPDRRTAGLPALAMRATGPRFPPPRPAGAARRGATQGAPA